MLKTLRIRLCCIFECMDIEKGLRTMEEGIKKEAPFHYNSIFILNDQLWSDTSLGRESNHESTNFLWKPSQAMSRKIFFFLTVYVAARR